MAPVQLFHHINTYRFSPVALQSKSGKCNISGLPITHRASPATTGTCEDHHTQPGRNRKRLKTDSDWSESRGGGDIESGKWSSKRKEDGSAFRLALITFWSRSYVVRCSSQKCFNYFRLLYFFKARYLLQTFVNPSLCWWVFDWTGLNESSFTALYDHWNSNVLPGFQVLS